jgi:hypothetical protein
MATRPEIYGQLYPLAEFVADPDAGPVMRKEAWIVIDQLLDELVEIQKVEHARV